LLYKQIINFTNKYIFEEKKLIKMSNDCLINPLMARNNKVVKETITPTTKKTKEEKQLIKMSNDYLINPLLIKNNKIVKKTIIPINKEESDYEYKTNYNYISDTILI
jgi:GTP:adenosylcobinamide-phosphate guanylyltransferase